MYKRLTAALLLGAEVATATGTAHPPPMLRRLQVGGWVGGSRVGVASGARLGHASCSPFCFCEGVVRKSSMLLAARSENKLMRGRNTAPPHCKRKPCLHSQPALSRPARRPGCCRSCLHLQSCPARTCGECRQQQSLICWPALSRGPICHVCARPLAHNVLDPRSASLPRRLAAAQLAAFVPCSILEAQPSPPEGAGFGAAGAAAGAAGASPPAPTTGGGNGGSSDAECVMVDAPPAVEALGGGGSSASLEAVPAGDSDALLLLATDREALRRKAVAYLDGLVAKVGRIPRKSGGWVRVIYEGRVGAKVGARFTGAERVGAGYLQGRAAKVGLIPQPSTLPNQTSLPATLARARAAGGGLLPTQASATKCNVLFLLPIPRLHSLTKAWTACLSLFATNTFFCSPSPSFTACQLHPVLSFLNSLTKAWTACSLPCVPERAAHRAAAPAAALPEPPPPALRLLPAPLRPSTPPRLQRRWLRPGRGEPKLCWRQQWLRRAGPRRRWLRCRRRRRGGRERQERQRKGKRRRREGRRMQIWRGLPCS